MSLTKISKRQYICIHAYALTAGLEVSGEFLPSGTGRREKARLVSGSEAK